MPDGSTTGHSPPSTHTCRTKEIFSTLCGDTFASIALRLPWTVHQKNLSLHMRPAMANISLVELLVSEKYVNCRDVVTTTQECPQYLFELWRLDGKNVQSDSMV